MIMSPAFTQNPILMTLPAVPNRSLRSTWISSTADKHVCLEKEVTITGLKWQGIHKEKQNSKNFSRKGAKLAKKFFKS